MNNSFLCENKNQLNLFFSLIISVKGLRPSLLRRILFGTNEEVVNRDSRGTVGFYCVTPPYVPE